MFSVFILQEELALIEPYSKHANMRELLLHHPNIPKLLLKDAKRSNLMPDLFR